METQSHTPRPPYRLSPFLRYSLALHGAALATLALAPRHWRKITGALVVNHAVISLAGTWPQSRLLGPNLCRLPASSNAAQTVALTFDDGPDPQVTPEVLELLEERGIQATFFAIGRRAALHPGLTREIVARGHRLENHTYHHYNSFSLRSPNILRHEIDRAQEVLTDLSGRRPRYFRAPAGVRSPLLESLLHPRGLLLTSWTHRGFDTLERRPERVVRRLTHHLRPGDILLLHDGNAARDRRGRPVVLEALPQILDILAERRLKAIPLPLG